MNALSNALFDQQDVYSLDDLNKVIQAYASNDDRLKDIVDSLLDYYVTVPQSAGRQIQSAAQTQAQVDAFYDLGDTAARLMPLAPGDALRYYTEIQNCFGLEPFTDLAAGAALDAKSWVKTLKVFTLLKGLLYWVQDGPNYEVEPTFTKDGSFFFSTLQKLETDGSLSYLLVDANGVPLTVNNTAIYRALPPGRSITLLDFWLNRITVRKLRTLYRLGAFELGIDSVYANDASYRFVDNAFTVDTASPALAELGRRFPCGFTTPGAFRFLRGDAQVYAPTADLSHLIPGPTSGVEDRVVMDESFVQTPMGVVRIPRSILCWQDLITDRTSDPVAGDPMIFIGLKLTVSVQERDTAQVLPMANPPTVDTAGFASSIQLLDKDTIDAPIHNLSAPLTGSQRDHLDVLGVYGHQHGFLVGIAQKDVGGATTTAQFVQIATELVTARVFSRDAADALTTPASTRDEVALINANSTALDTAPIRTFGLTPRKVLSLVAPEFTGFTHDVEQAALVAFSETGSTGSKHRQWQVILPIAVNLLKNDRPFTIDNRNGCLSRFQDAWAIRRISSVQKKLDTIIFDDGQGNPEAFPADFVGAEVTFFPANGAAIVGTIASQVGDKLAKLPGTIVDSLSAGDVVVINRRVPEGSIDHTYRGEVTAQSLVDLRVTVARLVDTEVDSAGFFSPSPSPAGEQFALKRTKTRDLITTQLQSAYQTMGTAIESKLCYDITQRFFAKAANRHDVTNLKVGADDLKAFLIQFVKDYDSNQDHEYVLGENVIIHWPAKNPRTVVKLTRYPRTRLLSEEDELAVEDTPGWGPVPVLTKLFTATNYNRYPIRFDSSLTFISDRSFSISGHTKLAGTFFLRPSNTQIVDPVVHITLYQTQLVNSVPTKIFLGSVDFDYRFANSFTNAAGIIRIDDTAAYDPTTQRLSIAYNQTINFSQDEPGLLTLAYSYHDLTQVHPLWQWFPSDYGVEVSHLANAEGVTIANGTVTPIPKLTMKLDGISINGGEVTIRWDRADCFTVVDGGASNGLRTKWVIRGVPFVVITGVTYNAVGEPIDVTYDAQWVNRNQTITTQIANDTRCRQTYQPCSLKYGWTDVTQSNINTEPVPFQANPRFGFYELQSFLNEGALRYADTIKTLFFVLERDPLDYRFTQPFDTTDTTDLEAVASVAVLFNPKTGKRTAVSGVFRSATNLGATVLLDDELTLTSVATQTTLFMHLGALGGDWVLDFAGMVVTVRDEVTAPEGVSKLAVVGYWYGAHDLTDRAAMTTVFGVDALQFNTVPHVAGNWRVGDVPNQHLYRDSNLLLTARKRPL